MVGGGALVVGQGLTIKLISAQQNLTAAGTGLSLAIMRFDNHSLCSTKTDYGNIVFIV